MYPQVSTIFRLNFLRSWADIGTPRVFWISGFYFPQSFLTGIAQNYARHHGVAVDEVRFIFTVTEHQDELPQEEDGDQVREYNVVLVS